MNDLDKALADIVEIKSRLAQTTSFRGLGPAALALTGILAFAIALAQSLWSGGNPAPFPYFAAWVGSAVAASALIGAEMLRRADRHHAGLADQMIREAVLNFVPAGVIGAGLLAFFALFAPALLWLLPGIWLLLVSLGIFAAARSLPPAMLLAGAWYLFAGFLVLLLAVRDQNLSPWYMGLPFTVGQLLVALIVHRSTETADAPESAPFAYDGLDHVMHEKARLGILTSLAGHPDGLSFNDLLRLCGLTQGNMSRHLTVLEEAGLVAISKGFEARRPRTDIRLTVEGRRRFLDYLSVLEQVIRDASAKAAPEPPKPARNAPAEGWWKGI